MANSKFHHEEILRGKDAIAKLAKPLIVIGGAGALGSNLVDNMIRQGFGNVRVIDRDTVDVHNINTQVWADSDVGALKVNALKSRMFRVAGVEIDALNRDLNAGNVQQAIKGAALFVDCFDNTKTRQIVQDACRAKKIPCLHVGLFANYGEVIWDATYRVPKENPAGDVCDYPLARNIAMLAVIVATEEIMDFVLESKPRQKNWSITLKDLKISEMR